MLLCTFIGFSQSSKIEKANAEFDKYAYVDAREIYLKVVEDGTTSAEIYQRLGDTFYWNSEYDKASKWYLRLISEYPAEVDVNYYYRAAQSLKSMGQDEQAKEFMETYITKGGDPGIVKANSRTGILEYEVEVEKVAINSENSDFGPSYYKDKIVYATAIDSTMGDNIHEWNEQPFLDLYAATMNEDGSLSNPEPLAGDVNTKYHESNPVFTADGKTMYFTRNNFTNGKKGKDKEKTIRLKLYKATLSGDNFWTNVEELPFSSDDYSVAHPALSVDEKRLYFSSDMPNAMAKGMSDLYYVEIKGNNEYGEPVNLGSGINTEARESFPFISSTNNLYFSSDGRGGLGGFDVFMTSLDENGLPNKIDNLGVPTNSPLDDFGFILDEEKRMGYLSSNRDGESGSVDDEIYSVRESCEPVIAGTVYDKETNEIIPNANVWLLDTDDNSVIAETMSDENGKFSFDQASCESSYLVRGSKVANGYDEPDEKVTSTGKVSATNEVGLYLNPGCPPNDLGCIIGILEPIYFDFDRYNIHQLAEVDLRKVLAAMQLYPELIIHIESHTDSRGNDAYNEALSDKRAKSTMKWLVDQGIRQNRLTAKGYGEYQLQNDCGNNADCTEEEHQLNRRSMFIIKN